MNAIKKLRREAGLSQWDVVTKMESVVSQATLSLWELGRRRPSPEQIQMLAKALGVQPKALTSSSSD